MEYPKPRCPQCSTPLPLRTITIKAVLCWNCEETINVAAGYKDHLPMPQASFTHEERDFAHRHGVVLDRRYSHTRHDQVPGQRLPKVRPHAGRLVHILRPQPRRAEH